MIYIGGNILDAELGLTDELLKSVDADLNRVDELAGAADFNDPADDPYSDPIDYLSHIDGIMGFGFVACQQYLNATYPYFMKRGVVKSRDKALKKGPMLDRSTISVARVVDKAANYWKHKDEWPVSSNSKVRVCGCTPPKPTKDCPFLSARKKPDYEAKIRSIFKAIGVPSDDWGRYSLSDVLAKLVGSGSSTPRFAEVLKPLRDWRDALVSEELDKPVVDGTYTPPP